MSEEIWLIEKNGNRLVRGFFESLYGANEHLKMMKEQAPKLTEGASVVRYVRERAAEPEGER